MEFSGLRLPKLILAGGLLVVLALYSMAWSGTLHLMTSRISTACTAFRISPAGCSLFFSGESGPTGRPLSRRLSRCSMNPGRIPKPFLIFNTLLHILNGLLCFLLLRRLLGWMLEDRALGRMAGGDCEPGVGGLPVSGQLESDGRAAHDRAVGVFCVAGAEYLYHCADRIPARFLALKPVAGIDCWGWYPAGRAGQGKWLSAAGISAADRMAAGWQRPDHDQAAAQGLFLGCPDGARWR